VEGQSPTCGSHAPLLHKECVPPLNVVRIAKTTLHPQARAQVTLCSSALDLSSTPHGDS
jgi:hypothetical protein